MDRSLLCYAKGRAGDWEAICLDLDISVQGESFDEVYGSLNESIEVFVETVMELPESDQARLLRRRSPWSVRLTFFRYVLRSLIGRSNNDNDQAQFTVACHA